MSLMFIDAKNKIKIAEKYSKKFYKKACRKLFFYELWFIAFKRKGHDGRFVFNDCIKIISPRNHFYADPFIIKRDKRNYVFFEDFSLYDNKAQISYIEIFDDNTYGKPKRAIVKDYHLSYPFLYEKDGNIYMIPETRQNHRIELYRAEAFPDKWVLDTVITDNIKAVDTTIFTRNEKLWMFTNIIGSPQKETKELFIYFADTIHGPWHNHPQNPVVTDRRTARPAGSLFYLDDKLIRPGQNCEGTYGNSIALNNVLVLNEHEYHEETIGIINHDWYPDNFCTHTYNFNEDVEVIDGQEYVFDLFKIMWSFIFRVTRLIKFVRHRFLTTDNHDG
jgi:hypothetical protein